jgi:diguanylate cyclase (GGDEF)-like protein
MISLPPVKRRTDAYRLTSIVASAATLLALVFVMTLIEVFAPSSLSAEPTLRPMAALSTLLVTLAIAIPCGLMFSLELLRAHDLAETARHLATTDQLTGLPNRSAALERIGKAIAACAAEGRIGALLYIDLDHFKTINDHFGHSGGDAALQHAATIMRETITPDMVLGRIGGEEFVCFAPDSAAAAAAAMAIIVTLRATSVEHYGSDIAVTASIGIAVMGDAITPEALLANADRALYLAKSSGRDRIVHHEDIRIVEEAMRRGQFTRKPPAASISEAA